MVLPAEVASENLPDVQSQPAVLSEADIRIRELETQEKVLRNENTHLREHTGKLNFDLEVQMGKFRKCTEEKDVIYRELEVLRAAKSLGTKKRDREQEAELAKAFKEVDYWKNQAKEAKRQAAMSASDGRKWEGRYSSTSLNLARCLEDNEKLKITVACEKERTSRARTESEALKELVGVLEKELQDQKEYIEAMIEDLRNRENDLICSLHEAQDDSRQWKAESDGRQLYIDHFTREMHKAISKAGEMIEKVKKMTQLVSPTERNGVRLLIFLTEAQEQYEQVRRFYGYNPSMMSDV